MRNISYEVSRDVSLVLRELARFDELLAEIVKAGITKVKGVELRVTQIREHKDKARALAVKAAKEKAAVMAAEIGQSIGKAVLISELGDNRFNPQAIANASTTMGGTPADSDSLFVAGLISVKANVIVSFELK